MFKLLLLRQFCTVRAREILKPGSIIKVNNSPHKVIKITMGKRGKGGGFVKAKLKNIITLNTFEKTYGSDELIEEANVEKPKVQFSWLDGNELVFIGINSFEEMRVSTDLVHNYGLLSAGEEYRLIKCEGKFTGVELPNICSCIVESIIPEARGGHPKSATLNTGAVIGVPDFISVGETIKVNSEDVEYVGRET